jgi:hypothetical protein
MRGKRVGIDGQYFTSGGRNKVQVRITILISAVRKQKGILDRLRVSNADFWAAALEAEAQKIMKWVVFPLK